MNNLKFLTKINLKVIFSVILSFLFFNSKAQETKSFATVNEVLVFAKSKNYTFKNAQFQTKLAEITRKTAIGNMINPKIPSSIQALNNINQQVSFLPGQDFGLPEGTFKEVVIGLQYVSTFNIQPQFDIINMASYAQIKSSKINEQLTENQNKINEQNIYNQINGVYFNILLLNAQKEIIQENVIAAKSIFQIVQNKFNDGIARKQEVNEAEVNLIVFQDKLEQVELNLKIQYQAFNLFFENQIKSILSQNLLEYEKTDAILQTQNNLQVENANLQSQLASQEFNALKYQNLPVLSFVSAFNWQNLSSDNFFVNNSQWINFNYVGLRLSYDLPTTIQKYSNLKSKSIQLELLKNNNEHIQKENENKNAQLLLEYEKALMQKNNLQKIFVLKKETYEKNYNQFKENILPLDKLLISQTDMINSNLNVAGALANIGFNKTKIEINNGF